MKYLLESDKNIYIEPKAKLNETLSVVGLDLSLILHDKSKHTYFESHPGIDYMSILTMEDNHIEIYHTETFLGFFYDNEEESLNNLEELLKKNKELTPGQILYRFFFFLSHEDSVHIEGVEDEIAKIEDMLENSLDTIYVQEMKNLRNLLLDYKSFYQSLESLLESQEDNMNNLIAENDLHLISLQLKRVNRLYDSISHLRDYITQVRETYLTQVGLSQNKIMQTLTIITAIVLPLELIATWYGMNLIMPEFKNPYAYPIVIAISIGVLLIIVATLKKKKWF